MSKAGWRRSASSTWRARGRAREGSTVKVASVIYQKAPFCFFSLDPGANVTKLKDFEGLRVGSNTGSYISNIARAMMRKEGLDPSKLSVESIEPSARIAMLATRRSRRSTSSSSPSRRWNGR